MINVSRHQNILSKSLLKAFAAVTVIFASQIGFAQANSQILSNQLANDFQTIDEASKTLGEVGRALHQQNDNRGLFPEVYSETLDEVNDRLNHGEFINTEWSKKIVINYANLYRETLRKELNNEGNKNAKSWQLHFNFIKAAKEAEKFVFPEDRQQSGLPTYSTDLDLVFSINVHISRDLVEALFISDTNYNSETYYQDFAHITDALMARSEKIFSVTKKYGACSLFEKLKLKIVNTWIKDLRDNVWKNAKSAEEQNLDKTEYLNKLDKRTESKSANGSIFLPVLSYLKAHLSKSKTKSNQPTEIEQLENADFKNPEKHNLTLSPKLPSEVKFTHEVTINLIAFRETTWTAPIIEQSMSRVAEIYAQCGIKIKSPTLYIVTAPDKKIDLTPSEEQQVITKFPLPHRPVIFFVNSFEDGAPAHAYGQAICSERPSRCDTAWITRYVKSDYYKELRDPNYSPIAHELGHIFGNRGHVSGYKNMLADTSDLVNDHITPEQCDAFKKFPGMKGQQNRL